MRRTSQDTDGKLSSFAYSFLDLMFISPLQSFKIHLSQHFGRVSIETI